MSSPTSTEARADPMRAPRITISVSRASVALGLTAVIGERVWDCQHKFRIIMGPLSLVDYERLLPGGDSLERLAAIVRNYIGDELQWDLNLVLKKAEVPPLQLGVQGRLGWTTWLMERHLDKDADDLKLAR
jgi:type VI secretion system protein ImpH